MLKIIHLLLLCSILIEFFFALTISNEDDLSRMHSFVPLNDYSKKVTDFDFGHYSSDYSQYFFLSSNWKASDNLILSGLFSPILNQSDNYLYYKMNIAYLIQYKLFLENKNIINISSHSLHYYNTNDFHWFSIAFQSVLEYKKIMSSLYWARYFSDLWYNNHVGFSIGIKNVYNVNLSAGFIINNIAEFSFSKYISIKLKL